MEASHPAFQQWYQGDSTQSLFMAQPNGCMLHPLVALISGATYADVNHRVGMMSLPDCVTGGCVCVTTGQYCADVLIIMCSMLARIITTVGNKCT